MAITLVSAPDPFALTKGGRMQYRFSGSGRLASAGVRAVNTLLVAGVVAAGQTLTLRWNGTDWPLKFVVNPAGPGEFKAGDGSQSYLALLAAELSTYYPLREDFTISFTPGFASIITLTAKKPGPAYNLNYSLGVQSGSPFSVGFETKGIDPIYRLEYSVYSEIWVQKPGTPGTDLVAHFRKVYDDFIACDENGDAQFEVGSILHSQLSADWPVWTSAEPTKAQHSHLKYYLVYGEAYDFPRKVWQLKYDQIRHAYLGGADYAHQAAGGYLLSQFEKKALRFGPLTRYVHLDQAQFLSFVNVSDAAYNNLNVEIKLYWTDGSSTLNNSLVETQQLAVGEKITFPVGVAQLDLTSLATGGKLLREYTIQILLEGAPFSELYRYVINGAFSPFTRQFAYLSSLGCTDTLYTYGKGSSELTRLSEQAQRYLSTGYDVKDGQFVDYNVRTQEQIEVATGFHAKSVLRGWHDFYRSDRRFRLKGGLALPISIGSKSIKQYKDGDTLFAHSFVYLYLYQNDFYTEDPDDAAGDGPLPANFIAMGGTVQITQAQVVHATDPTIPNYVRALTQDQVNAMLAVAARPNPSTLGFLDAETGAQLFRPKTETIDYLTEIANKPTTRDEAGLTDVPTKTEIETMTAGGLRLPADATSDTPDGLLGYDNVATSPTTIVKQAIYMSFVSVWNGLLAVMTGAQALVLKALLQQNLDETLGYGNVSSQSQVIGASHRKTLNLADSVEYIQATVYNPQSGLNEERYISVKSLARLQQSEFDFDLLAENLRAKLGLADTDVVSWKFGRTLACEDEYKALDRTDFSNQDFQ